MARGFARAIFFFLCYNNTMQKKDLENSLIAFTDGSSLGNPGPGGWGAIIIYPKTGEIIELGGAKPKTTNNAMELEAILAVLSYASNNDEELHIFSDSQYALNGVRQWIYTWSKNGWKTKDKNEVKNLFQWKNILKLVEMRGKERVHWHHLPSHVGIPGNERADEIAQAFASGQNIVLFRGNIQNYPIADILSFDFEQIEKKKKEKSGKAYSYLSLVDGVLERHETWAQCETRVKGKKAKFKKALSPEHEKEILREWGIDTDSF